MKDGVVLFKLCVFLIFFFCFFFFFFWGGGGGGGGERENVCFGLVSKGKVGPLVSTLFPPPFCFPSQLGLFVRSFCQRVGQQ